MYTKKQQYYRNIQYKKLNNNIISLELNTTTWYKIQNYTTNTKSSNNQYKIQNYTTNTDSSNNQYKIQNYTVHRNSSNSLNTIYENLIGINKKFPNTKYLNTISTEKAEQQQECKQISIYSINYEYPIFYKNQFTEYCEIVSTKDKIYLCKNPQTQIVLDNNIVLTIWKSIKDSIEFIIPMNINTLYEEQIHLNWEKEVFYKLLWICYIKEYIIISTPIYIYGKYFSYLYNYHKIYINKLGIPYYTDDIILSNCESIHMQYQRVWQNTVLKYSSINFFDKKYFKKFSICENTTMYKQQYNKIVLCKQNDSDKIYCYNTIIWEDYNITIDYTKLHQLCWNSQQSLLQTTNFDIIVDMSTLLHTNTNINILMSYATTYKPVVLYIKSYYGKVIYRPIYNSKSPYTHKVICEQISDISVKYFDGYIPPTDTIVSFRVNYSIKQTIELDGIYSSSRYKINELIYNYTPVYYDVKDIDINIVYNSIRKKTDTVIEIQNLNNLCTIYGKYVNDWNFIHYKKKIISCIWNRAIKDTIAQPIHGMAIIQCIYPTIYKKQYIKYIQPINSINNTHIQMYIKQHSIMDTFLIYKGTDLIIRANIVPMNTIKLFNYIQQIGDLYNKKNIITNDNTIIFNTTYSDSISFKDCMPLSQIFPGQSGTCIKVGKNFYNKHKYLYINNDITNDINNFVNALYVQIYDSIKEQYGIILIDIAQGAQELRIECNTLQYTNWQKLIASLLIDSNDINDIQSSWVKEFIYTFNKKRCIEFTVKYVYM